LFGTELGDSAIVCRYGNQDSVTSLVGVLGLAALVATVVVGMWGVGRLTARLVRLPRFRWFDAERDPVWWKRAVVLVAISFVPYVLAVSLFFGVFATQGIAEPATSTTVDVLDEGAARKAGMRDGDKVLAVGGDQVRTFDELRARVRAQAGPTRIRVERGGRELVLDVTPDETPTGSLIGVTPQVWMRSATFAESLSRAGKLPLDVVNDSAKALLTIHEKQELKRAVSITRETGKAGQDGLSSLFYFLGVLAAYHWPFFAGVHLFDAVTGWVFRTTYPIFGAGGPTRFGVPGTGSSAAGALGPAGSVGALPPVVGLRQGAGRKTLEGVPSQPGALPDPAARRLDGPPAA